MTADHDDLGWPVAPLGDAAPEAFAERMLVGELGLDGSLRPIRGALAICQAGGWSRNAGAFGWPFRGKR